MDRSVSGGRSIVTYPHEDARFDRVRIWLRVMVPRPAGIWDSARMTSSDTTPRGRAVPTVTSTPRDEALPPADATTLQYHLLRKSLIDGVFPPGTVLLETVISASRGVSRTPVREALGRLEQDGFLERTKRGYRVRVATPEDVLEIYEIRIALEAAAAASAAHQRTELDLARLRHLNSGLGDIDDPAEVAKSNSLFHEALWHSSHNRALANLLDRTVAQIRLIDRAPMASRENLSETRDEHDQIVLAIESRDSEAARAAVTGHLGRTRDVRLAALARQVNDNRSHPHQ